MRRGNRAPAIATAVACIRAPACDAARASAIRCSQGLLDIVAPGQHGIITRVFRESRHVTFEPPRQWMEPEDGAIQQRHPLDERIAPTDVLAFVQEDRVELPFSTPTSHAASDHGP